jgi:hypothetical protein
VTSPAIAIFLNIAASLAFATKAGRLTLIPIFRKHFGGKPRAGGNASETDAVRMGFSASMAMR